MRNMALPPIMSRLIEEFSKMPGIGSRSAQRLAFHILRSSSDEVNTLADSLKKVKEHVGSCKICSNLSEEKLCPICADPGRDRTKICVVEGPNGVISMERTGAYHGLYHVLLGELSPIDGIGPDDLNMDGLVRRVNKGGIKEVIVATNFTTEGETTALYISEILRPCSVKVTRLARGVPVGANLEYADVATIQRAFEERRGC